MPPEHVAIIGASGDRSKYGNKAVRAFTERGDVVYPVHPSESEIEDLQAFKSVLDIPHDLDRVSLYVPPHIGLKVIEEIAQKGAKQVYLNPGAESMELLEKAQELQVPVIVACSIMDIGMRPGQFGA
jgi:uncharacterized protein